MNTKTTTAIALLSIIAVAAVAGGILFAMQPTAKANTTVAVASDSEISSSESSVNSTNINSIGFGGFGGPQMMGMEPRFGIGFRGGMRCGFGPGPLQVSSEYTANVTVILQADSDVQNLLSQGFNVTSIHPVISTTVDGNGNVVTKASTANVMLEGNNSSRAFVVVDLSQAKVTRIVTLIVTEIDK